MGLLDTIFGGGDDEVKFNPTPLDPEANALIERQYQRSLRPQESFVKDRMDVVDSTPSLVTDQNLAGLGMENSSGLANAIKQRQVSRQGQNMKNIRLKQQFGGINDAFSANEIAFNSAKAAQKIQLRNTENLWKAEAANQEARAAVLRNLLGVGGMLAGAAIGGAPGAMIGAQAGNLTMGQPSNPAMFEASTSSGFKGDGSIPNNQSYLSGMRRDGNFKATDDYMPRLKGGGDESF